MGRNIALVASLAFIGMLGFLTVRVAIEDGVTFLVIVSILLLAVLGFGIIGALTAPTDD